jgi:sec-independent protein translocase protein TatC
MPVLFKGRSQKQRNSPEDPEEFRATLGEHLEELRSRIIRSVAVLFIGFVLGWFIQPYFYNAVQPVVEAAIQRGLPEGSEYREVFSDVTQPFMLTLRLAFLIGLVLAFPIIVLELWGFVAPGLKPSERKPIARMAPFSVVFFALGVVCCWFAVPSVFQWFGSYLGNFEGTALYQEPGRMLFFALRLALAFGVGFQLPLVVFLLGKVGLLTPATLFQYWRHAAAVIFIVSAVVTPADVFSMLVLAVPLFILFIASALAVKFFVKPQHDEELNDLD